MTILQPQKIIIFIATAMCLVAFFVTQFIHGFDRTNWQWYYQHVQTISDTCAIGQSTYSGELRNTNLTQVAFQPITLPLRGNSMVKPTFPNKVQAIRCQVDVGQYTSQKTPWMSVGPVSGDSLVYFAGKLRSEVSGASEVEFPLIADDLGGKRELLILSHGTAKGAAGPASLIPIFVTDDATWIMRIRRFRNSIKTDQPSFLMGLCVAIAFLVLILWWFGLRYVDIALIGLFAAQIAFLNLAMYLQIFVDDPTLLKRVRGAVNFSNALIPGTFLLYYTYRFRLISMQFIGAILIGGTIIALVPPNIFLEYKLLSTFQANLQFGFTLLCVSFICLRRRSNRIKPALCLGAIILSILSAQLWFRGVHEIYLLPFSQLAVLLFAGGLVCVDLARRQHDYFKEHDLREKSDAVAKAAQMLIHDIRRPFDMICALGKDANTIEKMMPQILAAQEQTDHLLTDLMTIGMTAKVEKAEFSAKELVEMALQGVHCRSSQTVELHVEIANVVLFCNHRQLTRVLQNIVTNALENMPDSGEIHVKISKSGTISIQNSNSFISIENCQKIFEFGYSNGRSDGTGIGLSFCQRVIGQHGGLIQCESSKAGGTRFEFSIEVKRSMGGENLSWTHEFAMREQMLVQSERNLNLPKLIVIDDDEIFGLAWSTQVDDASVEFYSSPEKFLSEIEKFRNSSHSIDSVVIDYHFKNSLLTGSDVAEKIRQILEPCPRLFLSTSRLIGSDELCRIDPKNIFDGIISKQPIGYSELKRKVAG